MTCWAERGRAWNPPEEWARLTTIDAHTAGEPLRIVVDGVPPIPGETMLAKRHYARTHLDHLRRLLMWEPRGHADMYGCVLTPPVTDDGDLGVLFLHNEGYSTMCGHGIIALVRVGIATGALAEAAGRGEVRIDTPAGRVTAFADPNWVPGQRVTFRNVPSFVLASGVEVDVPGVGPVVADVAFGGAFYAYVDAAEIGLELVPSEVAALIDAGRRITVAVDEAVDVQHPLGDSDLGFLYGTIFVGPSRDGAHHSRNVCVFAEAEVDRSPTGTGVSGRLAIHHARGELGAGEVIEVEGILGTTFTGRVMTTTTVGDHPAVVPEIGGVASITGRHEFLLDPADPLAAGFLLR